jgi:very-short-patch-repair endonuclease
LDAFGTFNWEQWQESARTPAGLDLPQDIKARLEIAFENAGAVLPWSKYLAAKNDCETMGLEVLVEKLESLEVPSNKLALAFEFVAYHSMGKTVFRRYPELSRFAGTSHEKLREEFASLDKDIIAANGFEFAYKIDKAKTITDGNSGARAGDYTEMNLLRREMSKQRRHIPIRQLLKRAGRTLQELKPCFMMGPLSVAQYLEPECLKFDLVVMDEASQLRPEEALGAIARGSQLIVVGDPKQLPPTSFFDRLMDGGDEEESDETPTVLAGMDSILDICQQLFHPVRTLRWHYRSRHESLIAFSNHHFYKNLIVFPSPYAKGGRLGVRYRYVRQGAYKDRQNIPEAQRVVDAVLDHMLRRSEESLGVVTLNQTQRELIEDLLDKRLRAFDEGQKFLAAHEEQGWPFFIKNLENVQGDERDVIFISTTFGKAVGTNKIRQNFGPISRPDGWRRLNVLFTRARLRVELFTSMQAEDIVVDEKTPLGTKALRDYLDFARRGVLTTTDETDREPDSDFEIAVANALRTHDYPVKPQHGVAGFYIDMAVRNPDRLGEFLAGVECDGAHYHSSASARDRDRIRQEILEGLGWKDRIYRIWSTDWFFDPRRETKKLLDFLNKRRATSQSDAEVLYYEEEPEPVETGLFDGSVAEQVAPSVDTAEAPASGSDDAFVEVGDRITYCFADNPQDKHTVQIVDSASNPKMNIVNENTPVALALLGCAVGEEGFLEAPGGPGRKLRVLKIHREGE